MPVLRLVGVSCSFLRGRNRVWVLQDVSLEVPAGKLVTVLSGPGQGKTTLIRVASGSLKPDEGSILVDGKEIAGIKEPRLTELLARTVAVARRDGPRARLTVEDYLLNSISATRQGSWRSRREQVHRTIRDFDLAGAETLRWRELSDWQRANLELAQAMIRSPRLLLVDDLLVELGWTAKQQTLERIETFVADTGSGVLMAVSDHTAATRGSLVHNLKEGKLRLRHTDPDLIPLEDRREARRSAN